MRSRKLSGAALAAELSGLPFPGPGVQLNPESQGMPADAVIEPMEKVAAAPSPALIEAPVRSSSANAKSKQSSAQKPRGGRPVKAGVDGMPVNVRLSQTDHLALAKLAGKLVVPGRPMPTVQDVVRGLIRGALHEPDLALRLCRQSEA